MNDFHTLAEPPDFPLILLQLSIFASLMDSSWVAEEMRLQEKLYTRSLKALNAMVEKINILECRFLEARDRCHLI